MIISVGYRVNSHRGVQFRQWATQVLKEYMIKGFVLNDDLLKNAPVFVMRYPNRELPTQRPADIAPAAEDPYEALSWKS